MSYQVKDISQYYEIIKEKLVVGCPNFFFQNFFQNTFNEFSKRFGIFFLYIITDILQIPNLQKHSTLP